MPRHIPILTVIMVGFLAILGLGVSVAVSQQIPPPIQTQPDPDLPVPDVRVDGRQVSGDFINLLETNGVPRDQAIAAAVNDLLLMEAAPRFGVVPSEAEVHAYIEWFVGLFSDVPPEKLAEANEILELQGLTLDGLTGDQTYSAFERVTTLANVRNFLFERELIADLTGTPVGQIPNQQALNVLKSGVAQGLDEAKSNNLALQEGAVQSFLAQELGDATIVVNDPAQ